jgi:hypothetical protein
MCHPELARQVLLNDKTFDKGGMMYDKIRGVVATASRHVLTCGQPTKPELAPLPSPCSLPNACTCDSPHEADPIRRAIDEHVHGIGRRERDEWHQPCCRIAGFGIYGTLDYGAWLVKLTCNRLAAGWVATH